MTTEIEKSPGHGLPGFSIIVFGFQLRAATIRELCHSKGISIVASMHDPNLASFFADEVIMLKKGKIMALGSVKTVMSKVYIEKLYDTAASSALIDEKMRIFISELSR